MGNYAQSFYCYSFVYTVLCKLIEQSCFSHYTMYHHFFFCAFGNISTAAVSLLYQCTKYWDLSVSRPKKWRRFSGNVN